jgi:hypothetical protein
MSALAGAGQAADDALGDDLGDLAHRLEVAVEAIGKPASITSTFISSRILASSSFSSSDMEAPGDCSPSRMVVSKMITRSEGGGDLGFDWRSSECALRGGFGCGRRIDTPERPAARDARA